MHSPLPWAVRAHLPDAHFEVVADAAGNTVGTATRPADADLIVAAVNGRAALRDMVRRLAEYIRFGHCNEVHIDRADTRQSYHVRAADLLREAEAALAKEAQA